MGYHIIIDDEDIKLHKADSLVFVDGHWYTPYCRLTSAGFFSGTGKAVLLIRKKDGYTIADRCFSDYLYVRQRDGLFSSHLKKN